MNKSIIKKIGNILLYLFLAISVFVMILTVFSKKDTDGTAELFGYQMRIVTSDSMAKCELTDVSNYKIKSIPIRSMIFVKTIPDDESKTDEWYRNLKVGDVITFRYVYTNQVTITHRITSITEKEDGGFIIELAGDNKNADSDQLYQMIDTSIPNNTNYVIGKVTGQFFLLGFILSLLKNPIGIVFIIIVPCCIIILFEIFKIVSVFHSERKKREQEMLLKKNDELEELRKKLAELEKNNVDKTQTTNPIDDEKEE